MAVTHPKPPPPPPWTLDGQRAPISAADDATFDAWVMLPEHDTRTLEEYAANPAPLVRRLPMPPPAPPPGREDRRALREELPPTLPPTTPSHYSALRLALRSAIASRRARPGGLRPTVRLAEPGALLELQPDSRLSILDGVSHLAAMAARRRECTHPDKLLLRTIGGPDLWVCDRCGERAGTTGVGCMHPMDRRMYVGDGSGSIECVDCKTVLFASRPTPPLNQSVRS